MKKLFALEASKNEEGIRLGVEKPETEKAWSKQKKGLSVPAAFGDQSLGEDERAALEMENRMMFAELENVSDEAAYVQDIFSYPIPISKYILFFFPTRNNDFMQP